MDNKNKTIITKESLIKNISYICNDDFVSMSDLIKLIDESTDENGIISKKKLIKSVKSKHTKSVVKDIYNILEHLIYQLLLTTNKNNNIVIKLFEGISINGTYIPEKIKKNNLTGETSIIPDKIKPKFNITRSYHEKLNDNKK